MEELPLGAKEAKRRRKIAGVILFWNLTILKRNAIILKKNSIYLVVG